VVMADLLNRQHGTISRDQSRLAGFTDDQVDERRRSGLLVSVAPRVFRVVSSPDTSWSRVWAAHLSLPGSVVSHRCAAWVQNWWSRPPTPELSIPHGRRGTPPGVIVHRRLADMQRRAVTIDGLRVTRPEVTVLECAAYLGPDPFRRLVDDYAGGQQARVERLADWFRLVCGRGIAGSAIAREELERRVAGDVAESRLERRFLDVIDRAGLPRPELQWVPPWNPDIRIDGAYHEARLLVELDSHRFHADPTSFERDRRRDLEAAAHGWRTVRITWAQLRNERQIVVALLRTALSLEP